MTEFPANQIATCLALFSEGMSADFIHELNGLTGRLHAYRLARRSRPMTPKLQGALQALKMLQHNVESDADEMVARIAELDARRRAARDKTHASLSSASISLGEIEEFVGALEGSNGAPSVSVPLPASPAPSEASEPSGPQSVGAIDTNIGAATEAAAKPAEGFPASA